MDIYSKICPNIIFLRQSKNSFFFKAYLLLYSLYNFEKTNFVKHHRCLSRVWAVSWWTKCMSKNVSWLRLYYNVDGCIPIFSTCLPIMSLFYSHTVVNTMEIYATVIQVSSLASYKTRSIQPFSIKIRKCLFQVKNMTVGIYLFYMFELLMLPFANGILV